MLILFSVRQTDRSNTKFATFSSGKTDNVQHLGAASVTVRSWAGLTTLQPLTLPDLPRRQSMVWLDLNVAES